MIGYGLINLFLSFVVLACILSLLSSGKSKNMTSLYLACAAAFIALFFNSLNYFVTDPQTRITFHEMKFVLYIFTPNFCLIYLLNKYYHKKNHIKKNVIALIILMLVETIIFSTNSIHHLIRKEIIVPEGTYSIITTVNNVGLYVLSAIQFSIFLFAVIFLIKQINIYYRKDRQIILIAAITFIIPLIGSPFYLLTSGVPNALYDWSFPLFALPIIGVSLIEIYTNITKRTPYARGGIFEALPYPIILIGSDGYIKDLNNAANKINIKVSDKISQTKVFQVFRNQSPITWHNNEVSIGNKVYKIHASYIDDDPSSKIKDVALILSDVTLLNEYIGILEYNSFHDVLTGVHNRKWFESYKERFSDSSKYPIGILITDINKFKLINDTYGHEAGDKALIYFSKVMKESFPDKSYLFRFGGDEFLAIVPNTSEEEMEEIVDEFKSNLDKSTITSAIGYIIKFDDSTNIERDIKEADTLMYQDKNKFYEDENN